VIASIAGLGRDANYSRVSVEKLRCMFSKDIRDVVYVVIVVKERPNVLEN